MFTGIIERLGTVRKARVGGGLNLDIDAGRMRNGLKPGDSMAIDGVCLTVTRVKNGIASFHAMRETVANTTLGLKRPGDLVNIERPLAINGRLGGHIVQGHVDGTGTVAKLARQRGQAVMRITARKGLLDEMVRKGSIAVDGVSLTIARLDRNGFAVAIIPHTMKHTALGAKKPGDKVNLETDIVGKHVRRLVQGLRAAGRP